jgi:hypothetical protein
MAQRTPKGLPSLQDEDEDYVRHVNKLVEQIA